MEMMQLLEGWDGYSAISDLRKPSDWAARLVKTSELLYETKLPPHRREYLLREAMTTSDFPALFGDILDRSVQAIYQTVPAEWRKFTKKKVNRDFRAARVFAIDGGDDLLPRVPEKGEYPASDRSEIYYALTTHKRGRQFDISWEALINDDLGALDDTPTRFAMAVANTEHAQTIGAFATNIGTIQEGSLGNLYQLNINAFDVPLTIANLEAACTTMRSFLSRSGMPMFNRPRYLVVPPALEFTARTILTSALQMRLATAASAEGPWPTSNPIANYGLELIVDDFLPLVIAQQQQTYGDTAWYLFADPASVPAVAAIHLAGHEGPEICMKHSNKVSIGGGDIGPMSGDFATDNVLYRVRMCYNASKMDWRGTWMSTGDASSS